MKLKLHITLVVALLATMVALAQPAAAAECNWDWADQNGGWGWDEFSEGLDCSPENNPGNGGGDGGDTGGSNNVAGEDDIVVLFSGQSNAIGERTQASDSTDSVSGNFGSGEVLVLPEGASSFVDVDLCFQDWHEGRTHPGRNNGNYCGNHPGFQLAKKLAQRTGKRVFLIPTGQDSQPIEQWIGNSIRDPQCFAYGSMQIPEGYDDQTRGMSEISERVAVLDGVTVDVVGWVQGEANANPNSDQYQCKLLELMAQLDELGGSIDFGSDTKFIATQLIPRGDVVGVNTGIEQARIWSSLGQYGANGDYFGYIDATNLGTGSDGYHYNTQGMRDIGQLMSNKFCELSTAC